MPKDSYDFDVALSFAGEDRNIVDSIVELLRPHDVRVFYDGDFQVDLWGSDLVEYFDAVYRLRSRFAVLFISRPYAEKMWTRHERRSALARGLEQAEPYVLPVRLDDTTLPGLRPTVGYLDARMLGAEGIAAAIRAKITGTHIEHAAPLARVPRTELERQRLLVERPPAWEYLLFGVELMRGVNRAEDKYRDHTLRLHGPALERVSATEVGRRLDAGAAEATAIVADVMQLLSPQVQTAAFGLPGQAGNHEQIIYLAARMTDSYVALIDWAARLRGLSVPADWRRATDLLARFNDVSIERYRQFVREFVSTADTLPAALARQEQIYVETHLVLEIDDEIVREYRRELRRINRKSGQYRG